MSILSKIFGSADERQASRLMPLVEKINGLEKEFEALSDPQLKGKTEEFRKRLNPPVGGGEALDELLPEAFAAVREASKRTLGQRHFDVQLLGGTVLHQGRIAEMKTGEGKTLASTLAIYLNSLEGKGVHVVTVNDYLSKRDTNWMGPIYQALGVSVGCVVHDKAYLFEPHSGPDRNEVTVEMQNLKEVPRPLAYQADITYGTNNEFGFDYLRDNMVQDLSQMAQRGHHYAIVDEVDSILIDEARTPLIISAPDADSGKLYETFSRIVPKLKAEEDYTIDEKMRTVSLSEEGIAKVEKILGMDIYNEGGIRYVHHLEQALRAEVLFKLDKDYVVKDGEAIIVDDFTGRLMFGRRYSEGLHQAIEAKEGVKVQQESRTLATITFQNYFRMYDKLAGMTGTAATNAEEFFKVYKLEVVVAPTNKPMVRQDLRDRIYRTENGKFIAVVREIKEKHKIGQPVLVGTVSIEKNELLSAYLKKEGIPHQLLNAKNHEQEAQIIAQAGQKGAVTVATNMAGRGVDIKLGEGVVEAGGLHILGTERHEARRIDNQLRGRAGRQGDPGSSQFFVSLEDDLMRIFGSDRIKRMMEVLKMPEDEAIENGMISKAIEGAQAKIEGYNFDVRKHVLDYDDVMNKQRERIYRWRKEILESKSRVIESETPLGGGERSNPAENHNTGSPRHLDDSAPRDDKRADLREQVSEWIGKEVRGLVEFNTAGDASEWNLKEIYEAANSIFPLPINAQQKIRELKERDEIINYLLEAARNAYELKEKEVGPQSMREIEKFLTLRTIDIFWMDHLDNMEHLRDSVRLRAYGQKDPLVEYKNEGHRLFRDLLAAIESNIVKSIYKVVLAKDAPRQELPLAQARENRGTDPSASASGNKNIGRPAQRGSSPAKLGRNDPCWCGSGKKYKKCHGK
ncbi:MAG: preprotein translocase subunit SecA [bacterium]